MKIFPDFSLEKKLWSENFDVIGIDEVGRGAFAGPVVVGGVVFPSDLSLENKKYLLSCGINDSKKLTAQKRESLSQIIKQTCWAYYISFVSVNFINKEGIGNATFLGMRQVAQKLLEKVKNPYLLIDALEIPDAAFAQKGVVKGDTLSISIASASIIAKVERDKFMTKLSSKVPHYGFERNKGYGTKYHRDIIRKIGLSNIHRVDFCKKTIA